MNEPCNVWVVDDDRSIRWVLERAFQKAGLRVQGFERGDAVLQAMERTQPDVVVTDIRMPGVQGLDLLQRIKARRPQIPVIVMTAHSDLEHAVDSYQRGAFDYLPKPFDIDEAVALVRRACALSREEQAPASSPRSGTRTPEIVGEAPAMQEVFRAIGRLSQSHMTVLITGESGTGKELVARALHRHSPRAQGPFVAVNAAAIPRDLLESELFGHEKGAFTGAQSQRRGRFEQAHGGTLFLDEIGDMPPELQTRLLRVLAEGEFYRVGGHISVKSDVRIIAATHQDLEQRVREGLFREDLYHRLNVIRIHLPALRERREDIPRLLEHFLAAAAEELGAERKVPRPEVVEYLSGLPWPGNVRQLQNVCRWLTVMASGREIFLHDLPPEIREPGVSTSRGGGWDAALADWVARRLNAGEEALATQVVTRVERILIQEALAHTGGKRQEAARLLGWGRNTLTRKIKELDLEQTTGEP